MSVLGRYGPIVTMFIPRQGMRMKQNTKYDSECAFCLYISFVYSVPLV